MDVITFVFGVLSDGYFWLGMVPGAFIGAWAVMQNRDYQRFQTLEAQKERDALFQKYMPPD